MRYNSALAYQMAAADGATHVGLLVLVYDAITGYLIRAADAARENNIKLRCANSGQVLLLVGHLETWVQLMDEPDLVASLRQFYAMLRARTIQLQGTPDPKQFEELADLVSQTRATWQAKEKALTTAVQSSSVPRFAVAVDEQAGSTAIKRLQLNA